MQHMDWVDFVDHYLVEELGAVHVVAGHDFHFGYMGKGNPQRLQDVCRELGVGCDIIGKVEQDGITISSTYIRTLIAQGEMDRAVQFLGHPHILTNRVAHGKKIGSSTLGFPTVNLRHPPGVIVPAFGVYATRVWLTGSAAWPPPMWGCAPRWRTTTARSRWRDLFWTFDGDLYGHEIRMEFSNYSGRSRSSPLCRPWPMRSAITPSRPGTISAS